MSWLSKKEAAEYLRVCESTIDNFESQGLLEGRRICQGRKKPIVRYLQSDLDNLFLKRARGRPRQEGQERRYWGEMLKKAKTMQMLEAIGRKTKSAREHLR